MSSLFERLRAVMPGSVQPQFKTAKELLEWNLNQQKITSKKVAAENQSTRLQKIIGRSGIHELHVNCSFENYVATSPRQVGALTKAKSYADSFGGMGGFIFSGSPGTGKNHLSAAICNQLMRSGKTVLIITVPDLMMKFRSTYNNDASIKEEQLMDELCTVDLLVIDEIGIQRKNSEHESIVLNQLIDRRLGKIKPTGMLTNLDFKGMSELLGDRIMDRMKMGGSVWVNFDWESYRSKVK